MRATDYPAASVAWPFRLLAPSRSFVSLQGAHLRLGDAKGNVSVALHVGMLEDFHVRRWWFWKRVSIPTTDGSRHTLRGVHRQGAARLREGVLDAARVFAGEVGPRLVSLDDDVTGVIAGKSYVRKSTTNALHPVLLEAVQGWGALVQANLTEGELAAFQRLSALAGPGQLEAARRTANESFIKTVMAEVRAAAPAGLPALTDEQARSIATDEDVTLVLAGAGTGKTSVIVGKVAHLVRNVGVSPSDILVVAYNRRAAQEIRNRLPGDLARAHVSTIHAFGRRVIAQCGVAPTISKRAEDEWALMGAMQRLLDEFLLDPDMGRVIVDFLANSSYPYRSPFDFVTRPEYDDYVHGAELRALSGDLVKSFEELEIANFLTMNGVDFLYERQYEHSTATPNYRQYQPDFWLPDHGIYIEHFALDASGNPPTAWTGYAEGVAWKRQTHHRYGTTLVETYSWQYQEDTLFPTLRARLAERGVSLAPIATEDLIALVAQQRVSTLAALLATFLNHVKTANLDGQALRRRAQEHRDRRRNHRFLAIFEKAYRRYQQLLEEEGAIDFNDLINDAARLVREGSWHMPYKYVLVDEFQDNSAGRMALLQSLKAPGVAYFLVGDDWQSIYRFAGSDVRILRECGAYLGHVQECSLSQTFRFGSGILEPAAAFVQRNQEQTQRRLLPNSAVADDGITVVFRENPQEGLALALAEVIGKSDDLRPEVLVLVRYNRSVQFLSLRQYQGPLQLDVSTVHRAKGREADYVVVVDLTDGRWGFPSKVEDDPLLELVLPPILGSAFPFAEERRVFYVAVTRARTGAYLITDPQRPSAFTLELLGESVQVRQWGEPSPKCPRCPSGRLLPSQTQNNLRCTNHPHCPHLSPRCSTCKEGYAVVTERFNQAACTNHLCNEHPAVCPQCGLGVLISKKGRYSPFWGCSEFGSEPSCRYTVSA